MTPLSADRYEVRFTARTEPRAKLKRAQDLLRHAVPSGDPAEIFDRALTALIDALSRKTMAIVRKPARAQRPSAVGARHVPAEVKRTVWERDGGTCAFVSPGGRRCNEPGWLELHHVKPFAAGGETTSANLQLRCRAHNAYEAAVFYGPMHPHSPRGELGAGPRFEGGPGVRHVVQAAAESTTRQRPHTEQPARNTQSGQRALKSFLG